VRIELSGPPEVVELEEQELAVRVPLSVRPDDELVETLGQSPPVSAFCARVEVVEEGLLLCPKDAEARGLGVALTAIESLIETANREAEEREKSERQRQGEVVRSRLAGELDDWWQKRA
jgi:hypothetical protein